MPKKKRKQRDAEEAAFLIQALDRAPEIIGALGSLIGGGNKAPAAPTLPTQPGQVVQTAMGPMVSVIAPDGSLKLAPTPRCRRPRAAGRLFLTRGHQ